MKRDRFPLLERLIAKPGIGEAWSAGRHAFNDRSPRNNSRSYEKIYVQAAEDYCDTCNLREAAVDLNVVTTLLAWPAIDDLQFNSLPEMVRKAAANLLPELEGINYKRPLTSVFKAQALPNPVNDVLLFLSTVTMAGIEADVPTLHQRMMDAHRMDENEACRRIWANVTARIDGQNGGNPPKSGSGGPVFH